MVSNLYNSQFIFLSCQLLSGCIEVLHLHGIKQYLHHLETMQKNTLKLPSLSSLSIPLYGEHKQRLSLPALEHHGGSIAGPTANDQTVLPIAQIPSLNYSPFEHHGHHFQSQQQTQPSGVQPHIPTQQDSHSPSSQQRQQQQLQQQQLHHHHQHEQQQQIGSQYYSVPFSVNGPIHAPVYPEVPRHYSLPVNVIPAQNGAHPIQGVYPHPLQGQTRRRPRSKRYTNLQCQRCGITETPEWRKGPNGARTLCNACGLFHAKVLKRDGAEAAALAVVNTEVKKRRRRQRKYKPNEPMTIQVPVPIALPIPMGMAPVPVQAQATTQAYC